MTEARGFFRNVLEALIDSRRREAQRMIEAYEARHGSISARRGGPVGY